MKLVQKRNGASVAGILKVLSSAISWNASEVHILPDRFELEIKAQPPQHPSSDLDDLIARCDVRPARLTGNAVSDLNSVFSISGGRGYYLTRIYVRSPVEYLESLGLPAGNSIMGVPIIEADALEESTVLFGLSKTPYGYPWTISVLWKGEKGERS